MLKLFICVSMVMAILQPPSGGCVLKLSIWDAFFWRFCQPPSGGCVLKLKTMYPVAI